MNRILQILLFLAALKLTGAASEEELVPWQSITVKSSELPIVGIVSVEASAEGSTFQKFTVTAFGRTHALRVTDLKRLESFPLSSLTLTHDAGYAQIGGHTLYLKLNRTYYDEAKKLKQEVVIISVQKNAAPIISEPKPR